MSEKDSLKGKYVSRAAFAKMQGERDRLKSDIYTMVMGTMFEAIMLKDKYRKEFEKDKMFIEAIRKELSKRNLPKDLCEPKIDSNPKAFK
jgi:hypothetical protein